MTLSIRKEYWLQKVVDSWENFSPDEYEIASYSDFLDNLNAFIDEITQTCQLAQEANRSLNPAANQNVLSRTWSGVCSKAAQILHLDISFESPESENANEFSRAINQAIADFKEQHLTPIHELNTLIKFLKNTNCSSESEYYHERETLCTNFIIESIPEFEGLLIPTALDELQRELLKNYQKYLDAFVQKHISIVINTKRAYPSSLASEQPALEQQRQAFRNTVFEDALKNNSDSVVYDFLAVIAEDSHRSFINNYPKIASGISLQTSSFDFVDSYLSNARNYALGLKEFVEQKCIEIYVRTKLTAVSEYYFANLNFQALSEDNDFFFHIHNFNTEQARIAVKTGFVNGALTDEFLTQYSKKLAKLLNKTLFNKGLPSPELNVSGIITESISYLLQNESLSDALTYLNQFANAHAFIQRTGWSTQNERSHLALLDFYNYFRGTKSIEEARSIILQLLQPILSPWYFEYRDIAYRDQFVVWKLTRSLVPIIIVITVVVLITLALSSLVLPDLLIAGIMIPSVVLGIAIASFYLRIKNDLSARIELALAHNNPYEVAAFQVNTQLTNLFETEESAKEIRLFYCRLFEQCDRNEIIYKQKFDSCIQIENTLKKSDPNSRERASNADAKKAWYQRKEDNTLKKNKLLIEWWDLAHNPDIEEQAALSLARARVRLEYKDYHSRARKTMRALSKNIAVSVKDSVESGTCNGATYGANRFFNAIPLTRRNFMELGKTTEKRDCRYLIT